MPDSKDATQGYYIISKGRRSQPEEAPPGQDRKI